MPTTPKRIPELNEQDKSRFWEKIKVGNPEDCWEWQRYRDKQGYGKVEILGSLYLAHRVAYVISNGEPSDCTPRILHGCDNPACCNPRHLWEGTDLDNARDRVNKGRSVHQYGDEHWTRVKPEFLARGEKNGSRKYPDRLSRGEDNASAKITADDVVAIRASYKAGETAISLSRKFNVCKNSIFNIVGRHTWKHIS